ncbi:AfsR/SARP family transcriptional regulator [Streptomyces wuyuanensis]|uniref:DNA-binding transcriptional activator of the SARP family n=1 Tax=Streptomyces wuyuanensis TaxID=1196353 RepID=A0A1H0BLH4_9ACTN|nr:DNA-binding transcriptional activator of the SARP family [Streptomyces wuyuanensis]
MGPVTTVTSAETLHLNLLGPVEAHRGGTPVRLGGPKPRTVLAALLLARGRVVSDTRLTTLLWDDRPPATCPAQLHTYASRVRHLLGPGIAVERRRPGYLIRLPEQGVRVDLLEFQKRAARGTEALAAGDPATAARELRRALAIWRGAALGGVCDPLADAERDRLEEERLVNLERRIDADLELGRHSALIPELIALIAADPLREGLRGQLMTALYRSGRQADALAAYRAARATLADELGLEPSAELRRLHQALLTGHPSLLPRFPRDAAPEASASPPPAVAAAAQSPAAPVPRVVPPPAPATPSPGRADRHQAPAELPPAPADFTGRDQEVMRLGTALTGRRPRRPDQAVHVVTGMPGIGKTAAVLQTAHRVRRSYPDGQIHLDLRGSGPEPLEPADALGELLRLVGVPAPLVPAALDERIRAWRTRTADRRLLLVLDDAADERRLRPLLPVTDGCSVLITSRSGLYALEGVSRTVLTPLAPPESRTLFEKLAGRSRTGAEPASATALVDACAGLPLALRIVGSKVAARPQWTLSRHADRLTDPDRTLAELAFSDLSLRDRLMDAYRRLEPAARRALRFHSALGPNPVPAATAARALGTGTEEAEELLADLAAVHWAEVAGRHGEHAYRLHPLVRLFARGMLAEEEGAVPRVLPVRSSWALTRTGDTA